MVRPKAPAPAWALGLVAVLLLGAALAALAALSVLGGQSPPETAAPPAEELAVEGTALTPGVIELTVRNTGSDPVQVAQVFVNDAYVDLIGGSDPIDPLATDTLRLVYPWQDGQPYLVSMLTSSGGVIEHEISAAVPAPEGGPAYFGLMILLGACVGIVPVVLGILFVPLLRRAGPTAVRVLFAVTVGLLAFLVFNTVAAGLALAQGTGAAFGGAALVVLGAAVAYLLLAGVDHRVHRRQPAHAENAGTAFRLALMIAAAVGLHNLGEGLAIGSAYAVGELALGAALVIGFALHNTTEGLAIVAPIAHARLTLGRLAVLGLVAGAPAVLGAWIGAAAFNRSLAAFLFGFGAGAIVQVIVQLAPSVRDEGGRILHPGAVGGLLAGMGVMFATGLLVTL
jgi:ZIP family zinc transporter